MNTTRLPSLFTSEPFGIDDAFRTFMRPFRWETAPETPQIKMDVTEVDKAYMVKAEIPGVRKEDIHVEIDGPQVMITAEVKKDLKRRRKAGCCAANAAMASRAASSRSASRLTAPRRLPNMRMACSR